MKKKMMSIMISLVAIATIAVMISKKNLNQKDVLNSAPIQEETAVQEISEMGKISQSLGHIIVKNLQNPNFKLDVDQMIQGMKDEVAGKSSPMTEEEYEKAISALQEKIFNELSESNLQAANAFLEKNSSEEKIVSVDSKLQYLILQEGQGSEVTQESTPLIHYKGTLLDGTVFGNSYEGEPIPLPVAHTIAGFSKGVVGMREGEKRRLFIHPDLAYGVNGQLPPNSLLIFEIEVVKNETVTSLIEESSYEKPICELSENSESQNENESDVENQIAPTRENQD